MLLGRSKCTTKRTLLLSIPMPKAIVATTTRMSSRAKASCTQRRPLLDDRVADVGPVEARDVARRVAEAQAGADVVARLRVGGGRTGDDGDAGEQPGQLPELHVLGAKVVAPLADAMRLVDGE